MSEPHPACTMIARQIEALDSIFQQAARDLNTVRGHERLDAWKKSTAALLTQEVGEAEARQFAAVRPGPSFTNDLVEELQDTIEVYRNHLTALAKRLKTRP